MNDYIGKPTKCEWCGLPFEDHNYPLLALIFENTIRHYHSPCYWEKKRRGEEDERKLEESYGGMEPIE